MKSDNLINDAISAAKNGCNEEVVSLLEQFLRANVIVGKNKFDLTKFVSKDTLRPAMQGILHESGLKIATNGNILVAIEDEYEEEFEGQIIGTKGNIIDQSTQKYPAWMSVLPYKDLNPVSLSDIDNTVKAIKEAAKLAKMEKRNVSVMIKDTDGEDLYFESENFLKFLSFCKQYPSAGIFLHGAGKKDKIFARDGYNVCLLMAYTRHYDNSIVNAN